jgi:hypothetical protein
MAKRLTPEEKAQRELDKAAKKVADREARHAALRAQWAAEDLAKRQAFESTLSQKDKDALNRILQPKEMVQDPYRPEGVLKAVFDNDFIESLYTQYHSRGHLSVNQLAAVVKQYDRLIETEQLVRNWPGIHEGQEVAVLCKVTAVEQRPNTGFGISFKIKLKSHYGRTFHVNTNAQRFLTVARTALEEQVPVNVQGKAGWVSPDGRIVVLDKKGLYFQGL